MLPSNKIGLHNMFGLELTSILTACDGDMSAGVKLEAWHGDRMLHQLVCHLAGDKQKLQRYEANSMLSWFLREGTDLLTEYLPRVRPCRSAATHSDHSFGAVFEAMLYRADKHQRREAVRIYMEWIDER